VNGTRAFPVSGPSGAAPRYVTKPHTIRVSLDTVRAQGL
jgi:hypothetical protein